MDKNEKRKIYSHKYYEKNKEKIVAQREVQRKTEQARIRQRRYYLRYRAKIKLAYRKCQYKLKVEVLTHYGNGKLACVKCGFSNLRALSIDHIDGAGGNHKRGKKKLTGLGLYTWLRLNNYPEGFQTLCMNCQYIKRVENNETRRELLKGDEQFY